MSEKRKIVMKKNVLLWLFAVCLAVCSGLIIIGVFRGTLATFHSDDAIAVLLAGEQLESGQLIPSDWAYGYEYWIMSLNLLVLPFLKLTGQMLLSRELAVIVQMFCLEVVLYLFLKKIMPKKWAMLGCILAIAPVSYIQMEHLYFQATYATTIMWAFVILILSWRFYQSDSVKKSLLWGTLLSVFIILMGCGGTRMLGTVILPMLGGFVLVELIQCEFHPILFLKHRKFVKKTAVICAAALGGLVAGNMLLRLGQVMGTQEMRICSYLDFFENLKLCITFLFEIYGCFEAETLMSGCGIMGVLKLCIALLSGIAIPVTLLVRFPKLSEGQKVFVVYSWLSAFVIIYMVIFCGLTNSYYLLPIYVNNAVLTCIFIDHYSKYISRVLMWGIFCLYIPVALYSCLFYGRYHYSTVDRWANFETVDMGLLDFLEENGLEFGYSDFFHAQAYTVASNGTIEIVSVAEKYEWSNVEGRMAVVIQNPVPRPWLSSNRWYSEEYHEGECFLMVRTEFLDELEQKYVDAADRMLTYDIFTILVYPENLACSLWTENGT